MRENWSITDEAAKGPSSDSRVCRSGATQGQMRTLVGDRYDKKPLAPHKRGAGRARAHRTSTPELAQTKRTVAKTACKIFTFVESQTFRLPHYFYRRMTQLGSPA
jgi:hypothetical protein